MTIAAPALFTNVHVFSFTARVEGDSATVLQMLGGLYTSPIPAPGPGGSQYACTFEVREKRSRSGSTTFSVRSASRERRDLQSAADVVAWLECEISAAAVAALGENLLIHAGAVAAPTGAILLPGCGGAGKSTLVAGLVQSGFQYLSDDVSPLDFPAGNALPFPKPVCLKTGGWRALQPTDWAVGNAVFATRPTGEPVHLYRVPPAHTCQSVAKVRWVILPAYSPGPPSTLLPFPRSEALLELARHSLNLPRHGKRGIALLASLVERVECLRLVYGDLGGAVAQVRALVLGEQGALMRHASEQQNSRSSGV